MPCKHEGGTDPCDRTASRHCKVRRNQYNSKVFSRLTPQRATNANQGRAGELVIRAMLLNMGKEVTVPENVNTPDDIHVKSVSGWKSVQVRSAAVNRKTGTWSPSAGGWTAISSELAALYNPDCITDVKFFWADTRKEFPIEEL